jgi:hypothetical protein
VIEGKDQPAAWYADSDESTGGAGAAADTTSTSGSASGAASVGSAGSNSGSGSGIESTAAPVEIVASTDELPAFGEVAKPKVERSGPAPREKQMAGIGGNKAAANALFEELQPSSAPNGNVPGSLASKVYEADGNYVVVQLIAHQQPNVADFDKDAEQRTSALRQQRANAFVESWLRDKCVALVKAGKIQPNPELLRETDDKGNPIASQYQPCFTMHGR